MSKDSDLQRQLNDAARIFDTSLYQPDREEAADRIDVLAAARINAYTERRRTEKP